MIMTHPHAAYVLAAYGLACGALLLLAGACWLEGRRARRRLAKTDKRT